jgi:superfamily II DNA or RNA helicase
MSILIDVPNNKEELNRLIKDTNVQGYETKYNRNPKVISCLSFTTNTNNNNILKIPFAYALKNGYKSRDNFKKQDMEFKGELKEEQLEIRKEIFDVLNEKKSVTLSLYTGFGKTITGIYLATKIKLKTCILVKGKKLLSQWKDSIFKVCKKVKVQILQGKVKVDDNSNFYIINVDSMKSRSANEFKNVGLLICDEMHKFCSDVYSKSFFKFSPKYLIGLSATPHDRKDGYNMILPLFFGDTIIKRELWRSCLVYQIDTKFKPIAKENTSGGLDWDSVIKSQAECKFRNDMIVKICLYFNKNILILCKHVKQCRLLYDEIKKYEKRVDLFMESQEEYDPNFRILIGTYSKCGVGFDEPKLEALILASDVEAQTQQFYGRIFRRKGIIPVVFDLIDSNYVLYKHWNTRKNKYKELGAIIIDFNTFFPEFFTFWSSLKIVLNI